MMKRLSFSLLLFHSFLALANPLESRQWHLNNEGQPIFIRESDLSFPAQNGVLGMDLNLPSQSELVNLRPQEEVIVAVIDTGVDLEHEDLQGRLWIDPNCEVTESNPCIGKNFLNPQGSALDDKGHGTHVAGLIAANDNEVGVKGVTPRNIKIMPLKVLNQQVDSFTYNRKLVSEYFADAIEFAINNGADVINMSVGFPQLVLTERFRNLIKLANQSQIPVIVAAGNNNKDIPVYPCSLEGVICVGSVDNRGSHSEFSNFGQSVDILAPGESIVSTYPSTQTSRNLRVKGYEKLKGTSQAAPLVSAVAALIKLYHPEEKLADLKARLLCNASSVERSADESESMNRKFSLGGRVNAKNAILGAVPTCLSPNFKENNQVVINAKDLSFEYKLKIDVLSGDNSDVSFQVLTDSRITLTQSNGKIENAKAGDNLEFTVAGNFNSIEADSIVPFQLSVKQGQKNYYYKANLSFSLDEGAFEAKTFELPRVRTGDIFSARGGRRFSLLRYVFSATNNKLLPEYFYRIRARVPTFGLIKVNESEAISHTIRLAAGENLVNVVKGDYNNDGEDDYLLLIQESSDDNNIFYLDYRNSALEPLVEKNRMKFVDTGSIMNLRSPLNPEGNLLNFQKRMINFEWLSYKLDGNDILVPIIRQEGLLPTEDNTDEFVNFVAPQLSVRRYALVPSIDGDIYELTPRTLMSYHREESLREKLYDMGDPIQPWENIRLENPLKLPQENAGAMEYLLSVGEFYQRRYFRYQLLGNGDYTLEAINALNNSDSGLILSGNATFPQVIPSTADENSLVSFKLNNRSNGRLAFTDKESGRTYVQRIESEGYTDPIFGFIGGFKMGQIYHSFFESRYWIHYFGDDNQHHLYPVNRESSFPGVEFSETMESVVVNDNGEYKPGIFVNSTLLYGNQVHAIVPTTEGLIRPLKFTIEIPRNCAYVLPANLGNEFVDSLVLNCVEQGRSVLKFIKLD